MKELTFGKYKGKDLKKPLQEIVIMMRMKMKMIPWHMCLMITILMYMMKKIQQSYPV